MNAYPVSVGQTTYPLRPTLHTGPLGHLSSLPSNNTMFRVLDGPPYANGAPHLGHVLNKHHKDACVRAAHLHNHATEWRPGWDCHGLPLELLVERLGHDRRDRANFVAAARATAAHHVAQQKNVFLQQGWSAQWENPYHTMDPVMQAGVMRVFAQLLERGAVDVHTQPVLWCPQCQSTLSGAEQEEHLRPTETWVVPFVLENGQALLSWTTTPWTLPLHEALLVSPTATYMLLQKNDAQAWVNAVHAPHWAKVLGATCTPHQCLGADLMGLSYTTPWHTAKRVLGDVQVSPQAGTGVLHAVGGLAELDSQLAATHHWATQEYVCADGTLCNSPLTAQNGHAVHEKLDDVRAAYSGTTWLCVQHQDMPQPHCWRHKTQLLMRPSRQVFVRLDEPTRARAHALVENMGFTPESGKRRLLGSMNTRPHWCVSRQRTWGVPLALFLDKHTQQPHSKAAHWVRRVADAVEREGVEAWWSHPTHTWLDDNDQENTLDRVDDVLDVWFDSACVPVLLGAADVVVEGTDQHRGWFQSCVWLAAALDGDAHMFHPNPHTTMPFKHVVTHGFVCAANGNKLAKSNPHAKTANNVPSWEHCNTDVVRLWSLMGSAGHDKEWSKATVDTAHALMLRCRGVLRFLLANSNAHVPLPHNQKQCVWDRYWWQQMQHTRDQVLRLCKLGGHGEAVALAAQCAERFSAVALQSWKDRLYCAPSQQRASLQSVVNQCVLLWAQVLEVLAPRMCAEAQAHLPSCVLVHCVLLTPEEEQEVAQVLDVRQRVSPVWEHMMQNKQQPSRQQMYCPDMPCWDVRVLADALNVGQCVHASAEHMKEVLPKVWVGASMSPWCPRCRRCQPTPAGAEVCTVCAQALGA